MVRKQKKSGPNSGKSAGKSAGKPFDKSSRRPPERSNDTSFDRQAGKSSAKAPGQRSTHTSNKANRSDEGGNNQRGDYRQRSDDQQDRQKDRQQDRQTNQFRPKHSDSVFLYGRNSVMAALANPKRECIRLFASDRAVETMDKSAVERVPVLSLAGPEMFTGLIPRDAPHQGLIMEVRPLPGYALEDMHPIEGQKNIILMLDQVTDPQNVGACLRSAAAFGARALITQDRNSPSESGALARASAGGLEITPWVRVANLSQTLEGLREMGYWHVGLDGNTEQTLKQVSLGDNIVIVMGSEGSGLRPLVQKTCDMIAKIPMTGAVESLNVSNAAAIALYELG